MNWIQDAASRLRKGTSVISGRPWESLGRVSSRRLISRGFGASNCAVSGRIAESSTLRKKRVPGAPSLGSARLFQLPSAGPEYLNARGGSRAGGGKPTPVPAGGGLSRLGAFECSR